MKQLQIGEKNWIPRKSSPLFKTCKGDDLVTYVSPNSLFHFAAAVLRVSASAPRRGEGHGALRREEQVIAFMNVNHVPEVAALKGDDKTRRDESDWRTLQQRESTNDKRLRACLAHRHLSIKCLTLCSDTLSDFYMLIAERVSERLSSWTSSNYGPINLNTFDFACLRIKKSPFILRSSHSVGVWSRPKVNAFQASVLEANFSLFCW